MSSDLFQDGRRNTFTGHLRVPMVQSIVLKGSELEQFNTLSVPSLG